MDTVTPRPHPPVSPAGRGPAFFPTAARFRAWLEAHHATERELVVGFYKVDSGKPSVTYPEALDEALCHGWIDGVRRSRDGDSYTIRFTPRKRDSIWSAVNLRHVARLKAAGRMRPAGLRVFQARDREKSRRYSFENRPAALDAARARRFRTNRRAWSWFAAQAPGYRRTAQWWVMSARQDATRDRRLAILIESSARGEKAPPFIVARPRS
jgi:uncharacterized protein YdeI (YjbR/CyaY-like superfamily)